MLKGWYSSLLLGLCLGLTTSQFLVDPDFIRGKGLSSDVFIVSNKANIRIHHDGDRFKIRRRSRDEVRPSLSVVGGAEISKAPPSRNIYQQTQDVNQPVKPDGTGHVVKVSEVGSNTIQATNVDEQQIKLQTRLEQGDVTIARKDSSLDSLQGTGSRGRSTDTTKNNGSQPQQVVIKPLQGAGNGDAFVNQANQDVATDIIIEGVQLKEQTVGGNDGRVDFIGQEGTQGQGTGQDLNPDQPVSDQNSFSENPGDGPGQIVPDIGQGQMPIDGQVIDGELQIQNQGNVGMNGESAPGLDPNVGQPGLDAGSIPVDQSGVGTPADQGVSINGITEPAQTTPADPQIQSGGTGQGQEILNQNDGSLRGQGEEGEINREIQQRENEDQDQGEQQMITPDVRSDNTGNQNQEQQEEGRETGPTISPGEQGTSTIQSTQGEVEQVETTVQSITQPDTDRESTTKEEQNQSGEQPQTEKKTEGKSETEKRENTDIESTEQSDTGKRKDSKSRDLKKYGRRDSDSWWDSDSWEFDSWDSDSWESKNRYRDGRRYIERDHGGVLKDDKRGRKRVTSKLFSDSDSSDSDNHFRRIKPALRVKTRFRDLNPNRRLTSSYRKTESSSDSFWDSSEDSSDESYLYKTLKPGKTRDKFKHYIFRDSDDTSESSDTTFRGKISVRSSNRNNDRKNSNYQLQRELKPRKFNYYSGSWEIVDDDSWSDSWESSDSGSDIYSRGKDRSKQISPKFKSIDNLKTGLKESSAVQTEMANRNSNEEQVTKYDKRYIRKNGGSSDFTDSSEWESDSWEYYDESNDISNVRSSQRRTVDAMSSLTKQLSRRKLSDDSSDERSKKFVRQREFKTIRTELSKVNPKPKSDELHYEVSGRVLLKKAGRRNFHFDDDSDDSDDRYKFVGKKSKIPKPSVPQDDKPRTFWLDTTKNVP